MQPTTKEGTEFKNGETLKVGAPLGVSTSLIVKATTRKVLTFQLGVHVNR